jgi:microsomal epoxide hydrolase
MSRIDWWAVVAALMGSTLLMAGEAPAQVTSGEAVVPYRIDVPEAVLRDLRTRLAQTRFPDQIDGSGWDYGADLQYMKDLVAYWRNGFDWRAQERRLNQLPQFTTTIDGVRIHFVHKRSTRADATPLVLVHGWPGSFFEFTKVIGPLTEPGASRGNAADAFHVVALSLPGYGFSGQPRQPGYGPRRMATVIAQLMARLGYTRYGAQGGDWGAAIVRQLGLVDASHLIGLHSNMCMANAPAGPTPNDGVPAEELAKIAAVQKKMANETAYFQIQSTKPMTLGYGLNDSPVGLAAWIVEKFRNWSDSGGNVERRFTKEELLTNVMIYWVTQTAPSSARLYFENRVDPGERGRVEAQYNLVQFTEMASGGHFAALEEPALLVDDVRRFFRRFR